MGNLTFILRGLASAYRAATKRSRGAVRPCLKKCVGVLLTAAVALSYGLLPAPAYTAEPKNGFSVGPGPSRFPQPATQDFSKSQLADRSATADVYANPDGTKTAVLSSTPMNVKRNGKWEKIDNTIIKRNGRHHNAMGAADVSFADASGAADLITVQDAGHSLTLGLGGAKESKAMTNKNKVIYKGAVDNGDLSYEVNNGSVREEIVLNKRPESAPKYEFTLNTEGLTPRQVDSGPIEFTNASGEVVFVIPQGRAWDSAKKPSESTVKVELTNNSTVVVTPDWKWLQSSLSYPVTIDPDIVFGKSPTGFYDAVQDTYTSSQNPHTNYVSSSPLKAGYCSATDENYTYIKWNLSEIANQQVTAARLDMKAEQSPTPSIMAGQPLKMWRVEQDYDPATITWNRNATLGEGGHGSTEMDLWGMTTTSTGGYDVTTWVQDWANGTPNHGVKMDGGGFAGACWKLTSNDASTLGPRLVVTIADPDTGRRDFHSFFDQTIDKTSGLSVNHANGNLAINSTDISAPGKAGSSLSINRNWSSLRSGALREFGNSWQLGANQTHLVVDFTQSTLYLPGLSPARFPLTGSTFSSPPGINADLVRTGSGTSEQYILTFHDSGEKWTFSPVNDRSDRFHLSKVADRNGNTTTYQYYLGANSGSNKWPRLTGIVDTYGQSTSIGYNASNQVTSITDFAGRSVNYTISGDRLTSVANTDGGITSYSYDTAGRVSQVQTPAGRKVAFTYDSAGRVSTIKWITAPTGDTDPTWTFAYQAPTGTPALGTTTVTDPNGSVTSYKWDSSLRVVETIDPNGHTQSGTWNANHNLTSATDGTGETSTATYDANNRLTATQSPNVDASTPGRSTSFSYATSTSMYQPSSSTDTQGNTSSFTYDTNGNGTSTANPSATSNLTSLTYNKPDGVNPDGNVKTATDPKGAVTTYNYNTAGRLTSITFPSPLGAESFTYDSVGRIATATDGKGQTSTYSYNAKNQILSVSTPGSTTVTYTYDADGLLTNQSDAAGNWTFTHDDLRRPKSKSAPDGTSNNVTYDRGGRVTSFSDASGTTNYGYDAAGNVTKLAEPGGSCSGTVSLCTTFQYDDANRRTHTSFPNGVTQFVAYDASGRTQYVWSTDSAGTRLTDLYYRYTNAGGADTGLTQYSGDDIAQEWTQYHYDELNRLVQVDVHRNSDDAIVDQWAFTWDANSNRATAWHQGSATRHFDYNSVDQLTGIDSNWTTYAYDANGARTSSNHGFAATYNTRGQTATMTSLTGGSAVSQTYMGTDQQIRVSSGSTTFHYRVIGGMSDQKTGSTTTSYILDPQGNVLGQKKGTSKQYFLSDKLGSIIGLMNNSGSVVQRFAYEPFGKLTTTSITVDSAFKYAGGFHDSLTGFYKFGNRYYDPDKANWTQRDVLAGNITDPKTMNRYVYVGGSPLDYVDPTGMAAVTLRGIMTTITGTVAGGMAASLVGGVGCLAAAPVCFIAAAAAGALWGGVAAGITTGVMGGSSDEVLGAATYGAIGGVLARR